MFLLPAWHVRLKPYYEQPQISETPVLKEELSELAGVKHEAGSGSEKENTEARSEKKRKRTLSSSSEDNVDPDFTPNTPGKSTHSTSTKSNELKREHKDKEKRREKEKKKKKDKDGDRDRDRERGQERSKEEREKTKSSSHNAGFKERSHDTPKKEKTDRPDSKISFKVAEPQSFEKLITETAGSVNGAGGPKKSLEERRNMSQLFPGQMKAESIKKKLALTPHSSPKHSSGSSGAQHKTPLKSSEAHHGKKPSESPVKKILNFDNPSKNVNILDQIMSNMSFPVNKE